MELSRSILKEFATVTNGIERPEKTIYLRGTIKSSGDSQYVRIDGSESLTPISEIVDVKEGDRVLVTIENHQATIIGNLTKPPSSYKEDEAIDKAEDALDKAESATDLAESAGIKADGALADAEKASGIANQAKQDAAEAITAAENASANSTEAKDLATAAGQNANTAREEAAAAQNAATAAQGEVTRIEGVVTEVKGDINTALEEVANQAADLQATKEKMEITYAKKTEVSDVKAALTTEISKKVGELQTTVSQTYAAKNEVVEMEGRLQSQITQTAGEVTSVVGKVEQLESDTTEAQQKVDEALEKSAAAQVAANQAQANASASQAAADAAKAQAATATQKATEAVKNATAAAATAAEADKKLSAAQTDLNEAKQNLANTINRVDATEAEIAEAQKKVETAQAAVTQAQRDAAEATLAANNAQTAANQAQNDATEAQNAATNAQKKADNAAIAAGNAQAAANKAQQDVAALTKRVTSAETAITQNSEQIKLSATKTEEIGNKLDNLKVGGENLFLDAAFRKKGLNLSQASNYIPGAWMAYNNHSSYRFGEYDNLVNYLQFASADKASLGITQFYDKEILQPGKEFSVRFYTMCETADYNISVFINKKFSNGSFSWYFLKPYEKIIQKSSDLIEHKIKFTIPENDDGVMYGVTLINRGNSTSNGQTIKMVKPKLEEGNTFTDFSISTKDMATQDDLTNNYYSKTQTDAAIKVAADNVTTTVRTETTEQITNINIGGENLFLDSAFRKKEFKATRSENYIPGHWVKFNGKNFTFSEYEGIINEASFSSAQGDTNGIMQFFENNTLQPGKEYRIRFYAKSSSPNSIIKIYIAAKDSSGNFNWYWKTAYNDSIKKANEYTEIKAELKIPENAKSQMYGISLVNYGTSETNGATITFVKPKLEVGNRYTDFSQSGKDLATAEQAQNAQNTANTANNKANAIQTQVSSISQKADRIESEVFDSATGLKTKVTQLSNEWSVNALNGSGDILSQLNVNGGSVKIKSALIELDGYTTMAEAFIKKLTANSIVTETIDAHSATIAKAAITNLDATNIKSGYLDAQRIKAGSITVDKLKTTNLSSITANLGTVTAGKIQSSDKKFIVDIDGKKITSNSMSSSGTYSSLSITEGKIEIEKMNSAHPSTLSLTDYTITVGEAGNGTAINGGRISATSISVSGVSTNSLSIGSNSITSTNISNWNTAYSKATSAYNWTSGTGYRYQSGRIDLTGGSFNTTGSAVQITANAGPVNLQGASVNIRNMSNSAYATCYAANFSSQSAYSAKTDFENIDNMTMLQAILKTDIVKYRFKNNPQKYVGFIINDNGHSPYMIDNLLVNDDNSSFSSNTAIGVAYGAIKELNRKLEKLEAENFLLQAKLEAMT